MKTIILIIFFSTSLLFAQAPVYLNLGSHNETNDPLHYQTTYADYELAKTLILQIADSVEIHLAKWNMQVDANFIRGCIAHDTARTNVNNLLNWADDQTYIEVDPHNHFNPIANPYNQTDLNHLLVDSCLIGIDRNNVGGFIWRDFAASECTPPNPAIPENWSLYNSGSENGNKFPLESWRPTVLWGGGSPSHCDDSNTLGIWKPGGPTSSTFYVHTPGNYETVIGSNCGDKYAIFDTTDVNDVINEVIDLINYAQAYGNASTDFYTLTVMFNFKHIDSPGMVDKISSFLRTMDMYVAQNKVVWATLTEKHDTWYATHTTNDSFIKQCDQMNIGIDPIDISDMTTVFPNPATDLINIRFPYEFDDAEYRLIDITGKIVSSGQVSSLKVQLPLLPNGFYTLILNIDGNFATKKILIQR